MNANLSTIVPVLDRLTRSSFYEPHFIWGFDFESHCGRVPRGSLNLSEQRSWNEFIHEDDISELDSKASRILEQWENLFCDENATEGEVASLFHSLKRVPWRNELPHLIRTYVRMESALQNLIQTEKPVMAVLPEDTDYVRGRLAARILKEHRIPRVVFLPMFYNVFESYPLFDEPLADDYFVLDDRVAARLRHRGVENKKIHVVGHPSLETPRSVDRWGPLRRILFSLQNQPWENVLLEDLLSIVNESPRIELLVKQHPHSHNSAISDRLRCALGVTEIRSGDLQDYFNSETCVVGQTSSSLYHAAAAGVVSIAVQYGSLPSQLARPTRAGRWFEVDDFRGLRECLLSLSERELEDFIPPFTTGGTESLIEYFDERLQPFGDKNPLVSRTSRHYGRPNE